MWYLRGSIAALAALGTLAISASLDLSGDAAAILFIVALIATPFLLRRMGLR